MRFYQIRPEDGCTNQNIKFINLQNVMFISESRGVVSIDLPQVKIRFEPQDSAAFIDRLVSPFRD